jgi:hypothetical protein
MSQIGRLRCPHVLVDVGNPKRSRRIRQQRFCPAIARNLTENDFLRDRTYAYNDVEAGFLVI